mgnify:FL=1
MPRIGRNRKITALDLSRQLRFFAKDLDTHQAYVAANLLNVGFFSLAE